MMSAPARTPDLIGALDGARPYVIGGTLPIELDAPTLDALMRAVDDRIEVAPVDELLELHRGRRALELELAHVLEA